MIDTHIIDSLYNTYIIHIVTADNRKLLAENSKHLIDSTLRYILEGNMRKTYTFYNIFYLFVT